MPTPQLDRIAREGTSIGRSSKSLPSNRIVCADGTKLSVIAHGGAYCEPRPAFISDPAPEGGFTAVEVGFPSVRPEPWNVWSQFCENTDDPTGTVYGYVPVQTVRAFVEAHGGER